MFAIRALKYAKKVSFLVPPPYENWINSIPFKEMVAVQVRFLVNNYLV